MKHVTVGSSVSPLHSICNSGCFLFNLNAVVWYDKQIWCRNDGEKWDKRIKLRKKVKFHFVSFLLFIYYYLQCGIRDKIATVFVAKASQIKFTSISFYVGGWYQLESKEMRHKKIRFVFLTLYSKLKLNFVSREREERKKPTGAFCRFYCTIIWSAIFFSFHSSIIKVLHCNYVCMTETSNARCSLFCLHCTLISYFVTPKWDPIFHLK